MSDFESAKQSLGASAEAMRSGNFGAKSSEEIERHMQGVMEEIAKSSDMSWLPEQLDRIEALLIRIAEQTGTKP